MENKKITDVNNPLKNVTTFRHQEARDNQEVVTPPDLVGLIYSYLEPEDFEGDILDPCVGPGAMSLPIIKENKYKSFTMSDIQSEHIENLNKLLPDAKVEKVEKVKIQTMIEW